MKDQPSEADLLTRFVRPLDYAAFVSQNREIFLINHAHDFIAFDSMLQDLQRIWLRVARERDNDKKSHFGLFLHASLLIRHSLLGFYALSSAQSLLAWYVFRPGLEAILMIGKWVDDPRNADVWKKQKHDRRQYRAIYDGRALISKSLPNSSSFRAVLTKINDEYSHPNPVFGFRQTTIFEASAKTGLHETPFFDREKDLQDAHVLAYVHLFAMIAESSSLLLDRLLGATRGAYTPAGTFVAQNSESAHTACRQEPTS